MAKKATKRPAPKAEPLTDEQKAKRALMCCGQPGSIKLSESHVKSLARLVDDRGVLVNAKAAEKVEAIAAAAVAAYRKESKPK